MSIREALNAEDEALLAHLSPTERAAMAEAIDDDPADTVIISEVPAARTEPKDKAQAAEPGAKPNATDDEPVAKKEAMDEDDDDEDDDDDGNTEASAAAAAKAVEVTKAAQEQAAADEAAAAAAKTADLEGIELDLTPAQQQYETALKTLDDAKAEKFQAMMDGDITAKEYAEFESQYLKDRDAAAEQRTGFNEWLGHIHELKVKAATEDGINYVKDVERATALDQWTKMLGNDPSNATKPPQWFLQEAHRRVMIQFGDAPGAAAAPDAGKKETAQAKKVDQKQGRAPNLGKIPPTLAEIPNADDSSGVGDGGEFENLNALAAKGGMEFERALARLSPEQRDRYERS